MKYASLLFAMLLGAAVMRLYDTHHPPGGDEKAATGIIAQPQTVTPHDYGHGFTFDEPFCGPQQPPKLPPHPHGIH